MHTLHPKACGLALGSVWGLGIIALALVAMFAENYGDTAISIVSSVYRGYRPDIPGALIGGIWGFADGFIGGYLFALFYNKFLSQEPSHAGISQGRHFD